MECCLDCLLLLLAVEALNLEVVVVDLEGHCYCLDCCQGVRLLVGTPPPELLKPAPPPPGCALPDGLDGSLASDPVPPPPESSGGPPPPELLGLVFRGVHSLGYVTALVVAVPCCLGLGGGWWYSSGWKNAWRCAKSWSCFT